MARKYSGKKGKSGSTKPQKKEVPSWVIYKPKEAEQLVVKLAKEHQSAKIGLILRDSYGIPSVQILTQKSVTQILEEHKLAPQLPEDLMNLIRREVKLLSHLEKNHKDQVAKRGLTLTNSKIRRLTRYYKETGKLPSEWKYSREQARLLAA